MGVPEAKHMSYAEYLAAEQASELEHEYLCGEVFAMAGGTLHRPRLRDPENPPSPPADIRRAPGRRASPWPRA